jgi:nucleoid-associated protein YgaU
MTRETKIGLLVGLAFIVVVGILLSDHFRGTMDVAPAGLDRVGANARQAVNAPGSSWSNPPAVVTPSDVAPHGLVQTPPDIDGQHSPVVVEANPPQPQSATQITGTPLAIVAEKQGEDLIPADQSVGQLPKAVPPPSNDQTYVAQPGDTLSRMAAKLLGANTKKNRQAIIAANPTLQDDPNKIIAGESYTIPVAGAAGTPMAAAASGNAVSSSSTAQASQWSYTVKSGDTLWGIATGQLGDPSTIDAIKELNEDQLHGGNTLRPGMKLRLPGHPVVVAD